MWFWWDSSFLGEHMNKPWPKRCCLLSTAYSWDWGKESKQGQPSSVILTEKGKRVHSLFAEIYSCEDDGNVMLGSTSARYWGGSCLRMTLRVKRSQEMKRVKDDSLTIGSEPTHTAMPEVHASMDILVVKSRHQFTLNFCSLQPK